MERPRPGSAGLLALWLAGALAAGGTKESTVVDLWPEDTLPPAAEGKEEKAVVSPWRDTETTITRIHNVARPTLTLFPARGSQPRPAILVCPGGGYHILAYDLEGTEVAEWLNGLGITVAVLKYRVPGQRDAAFRDAQRAMGLMRSRATEWGIAPRRLGILGFSAGAHLAARLCTNYEKRAYEAVDAADRASCRPDFAVLIYPAYLANREGRGLDTETLPVSADTPATFVAVACNDKFAPGALHYVLALRRAGVGCEMHLFQSGSHGCGLRPSAEAMTTWPEPCARWLRDIGVLEEK
ncbi:MAG: alpha/beta hydrolase [Candidatus Brocadiia bacterium]